MKLHGNGEITYVSENSQYTLSSVKCLCCHLALDP